MRPLAWLASAGMLLILLTAVQGWTALRELSANREWRSIDASPDGASINGVQLAVQTQTAAVAAPRPERAALLVRLKIQAPPAALEAWQDCRVSLHGLEGQVWMPLASANADGAVKALSPDGRNFGPCRLYAAQGQEEQQERETLYADQLFLLPSDGLQGLRLHVSGRGTRPRALSFAIAPEIRRFQ